MENKNKKSVDYKDAEAMDRAARDLDLSPTAGASQEGRGNIPDYAKGDTLGGPAESLGIAPSISEEKGGTVSGGGTKGKK